MTDRRLTPFFDFTRTKFILAETCMLIKKILSSIALLFFMANCLAQETVEKKNRINNHVKEAFQVLKNNEQIKEGLYQAFYNRKTQVAIGHYVNNKRSGMWYFYDPKGTLIQMFNYTKDSLRYEAREDTTSDMRYLIDKVISDTDRVTKPVKIGGRYYGYLPYLGFYKTYYDADVYQTPGSVAIVELLISPLGRLAEYKVRVISPSYQIDQTNTIDINLFKEDDKKFIPATFNHQAVLSRIMITCRVTDDGGLDFF